MLKVAVFGARGRMGQELCRAIGEADDLELVAALDVGDDREPARAADVAVDFTVPDAVMGNLEWCAEQGIHAVVGTTGITAERLERIRELFSGDANAVVASNYSIGSLLMMKFAEIAAPFFESVEIIELHHPNKVDAPSGTAVTTAGRIAAARAAAGLGATPDATELDPDIKIMFITGFAAVVLNNDNAAPKDARVLSKPFHLKDLVREVDRLLAE